MEVMRPLIRHCLYILLHSVSNRQYQPILENMAHIVPDPEEDMGLPCPNEFRWDFKHSLEIQSDVNSRICNSTAPASVRL